MTSKIIEWDESFNVGVEQMNDEHKVIIDLIGQLFMMSESDTPFEKIVNTLEELSSFTSKHFTDEEAYMESVDYQYLKEHQKIHETLKMDLNDFIAQIKESKILSAPFFHFLNMWLREHIQTADMSYHPNIVARNKRVS
jgi:hemerythrin